MANLFNTRSAILGNVRIPPMNADFFTGPILPKEKRAPAGFIGPILPEKKRPAVDWAKLGVHVPSKPSGSVLGTSTGVSGIGTGSSDTGRNQQDVQSLVNRAPLEETPDAPNIDYDALIAPALGALGGFEESLRQQLPGQIQGIEREAAVTRSGLEAERKRRLEGLGQQRTKAQQKTKSSIAEARRQGAELLSGLQARFGGTTGTGAFVGELTGREVLRNIANNRVALQNTLSQISDAEQSIEREVSNQLRGLEARLENAKAELRRGLMNRIQEINLKKGELESRKAEAKLDAMREFRQLQAEINARNAAFKQQLFAGFEQSRGQLRTLKERAAQTFSTALQIADLSGFRLAEGQFPGGITAGQLAGPAPSNLRFVPKEELTPEEEARRFLEGG